MNVHDQDRPLRKSHWAWISIWAFVCAMSVAAFMMTTMGDESTGFFRVVCMFLFLIIGSVNGAVAGVVGLYTKQHPLVSIVGILSNTALFATVIVIVLRA